MKISFKEFVAYFIIFFAGFQGIIFFFADLSQGETELSRLIIAFFYYFITALLVNWLNEFRGEKALLLLWGVSIVSLLTIPELLSMRSFDAASHNLFMVLVPLAAISLARKSFALFGNQKKASIKKRKGTSKRKK